MRGGDYSMNRKVLVGIIVLLAGLAVGWFVLQGAPGQTLPAAVPTPTVSQAGTSLPQDNTSGIPDVSPAAGETMEKGGAPVIAASAVAYTDSGFTPNTVTVKAGTAVRFTNQSNRGMWVASGVHPTHQLLPGFDQLKSVAKGGTYDYTFAEVGKWQYHNHVNATDLGYVVVTQ